MSYSSIYFSQLNFKATGTTTPVPLKYFASFDGVNDYITMPLTDFGSSLRTFEVDLWVRTSNTQKSASIFRIINAGTGGGNTSNDQIFSIQTNRSTAGAAAPNVTTFYLRDTTGKIMQSSINFPTLYDGNWHHIVWRVVDSALTVAGNHKVYVDKNLMTFNSNVRGGPSAFVPFTAPVYLGAENRRGALQEAFVGDIRNPRFWTTMTDTQARVDQLYDNYYTTPQTGLVANYLLNSNGLDSSGNGRNGTVFNGVTFGQV